MRLLSTVHDGPHKSQGHRSRRNTIPIDSRGTLQGLDWMKQVDASYGHGVVQRIHYPFAGFLARIDAIREGLLTRS